MNFQVLPKVELHLHLDCSLSFEVVSEMNPKLTHQEYLDQFVAPTKCTQLVELIQKASNGTALMQTREQLQKVTSDLFRQLKKDQVVYAEIRFAPLLHLEKGLTSQQVVETVHETVQKEIQATGIEAKLILCTLRHFSEKQSLETVQLAEEFKTGIDLAADEAGFPITSHIAAFKYAIQKDIPRTAHAGEAKGPESIWETLEFFKPRRVGHGIRSIEDPKLLEYLKQNQIHLEVCPTSNFQLALCGAYSDHPIDQLYRAGISVGINTDARALCHLTLTEEYQKLHQAFGWGKEQFLNCNLNAIQASFAPESVKEKIRKILQQGYNRTDLS